MNVRILEKNVAQSLVNTIMLVLLGMGRKNVEEGKPQHKVDVQNKGFN